jgi:hypothetical protein
VPMEQEAGWASGLFRTFWRKERSLLLPGFEPCFLSCTVCSSVTSQVQNASSLVQSSCSTQVETLWGKIKSFLGTVRRKHYKNKPRPYLSSFCL